MGNALGRPISLRKRTEGLSRTVKELFPFMYQMAEQIKVMQELLGIVAKDILHRERYGPPLPTEDLQFVETFLETMEEKDAGNL